MVCTAMADDVHGKMLGWAIVPSSNMLLQPEGNEKVRMLICFQA